MSHLISPLRDLSLADGLTALAQAHDFIATNAATCLESRRDKPRTGPGKWGCDFKRINIDLPLGRPERQFTDSTGRARILIEESVKQQKLIEIINQAATLERLMDVLKWAMSDSSRLSEYRILLCHPTTSSENDDNCALDHDLVLTGPEGIARFEVSDVASNKDGNRKEEKDLRSLGLLQEGKGELKFRVKEWPPGRLFLVVSFEWKKRLKPKTRRWVKNRKVSGVQIPPHLEMMPIEWPSETGIFEIHRGKGFGINIEENTESTPEH